MRAGNPRVAVRDLNCKSYQVTTVALRYSQNDFLDGVRPPSWICKILIWDRLMTIFGIKSCICIPNVVEIGWFLASCYKMVAVRHLEFSKFATFVTWPCLRNRYIYLTFFNLPRPATATTVRDRNSGNYGFQTSLILLSVTCFNQGRAPRPPPSPPQSQQGCLRLRKLRHVTNCVIISSN